MQNNTTLEDTVRGFKSPASHDEILGLKVKSGRGTFTS